MTESGVPISQSRDFQLLGAEDGCVVLKIGSGKYHFVSE
jgi:hypothetical protein